MKCFFHSADLDGHCSGAIVKHFAPQCEMIGINYGKPFPWAEIESGETVFMVDFTLQPFEDMERLLNICNLVWIDHHKTAIEEAERRGFKAPGLRRVGIGACALTWESFDYDNGETPIPEAVRLLAEYDVWNHSDPLTLPFQYGMRMNENTWPDNQEFWEQLLGTSESERRYADALIAKTVEVGETILAYEKSQNEKFCKAYSFETEFDGKMAIACNRGFTNSQVFESVWDPEQYDLMLTFCRLKPPAGKWTVSIYSDKDDIDCGNIARKFGGGGHKGAAGFQCSKLPFEI